MKDIADDTLQLGKLVHEKHCLVVTCEFCSGTNDIINSSNQTGLRLTRAARELKEIFENCHTIDSGKISVAENRSTSTITAKKVGAGVFGLKGAPPWRGFSLQA